MSDKAPIKAVFTIRALGNGQKAWTRIGVAFVNRDGSINVKLDALPTNAELHIRDFEVRPVASMSEVADAA